MRNVFYHKWPRKFKWSVQAIRLRFSRFAGNEPVSGSAVRDYKTKTVRHSLCAAGVIHSQSPDSPSERICGRWLERCRNSIHKQYDRNRPKFPCAFKSDRVRIPDRDSILVGLAAGIILRLCSRHSDRFPPSKESSRVDLVVLPYGLCLWLFNLPSRCFLLSGLWSCTDSSTSWKISI